MTRIALLTNFIPPYRIPLFKEISGRVSGMRIFVSTDMEGGRPWRPDSGGLDVVLQRCFTRRRIWSHPHGYVERVYTHFPYDTLNKLGRFRPTIVISAEFGFRTLSSALYRMLWRRSRLIVWATLSEHTELDRGWRRVFLRRFLLRASDAVLVNGESGFRYLNSFGYPAARIFRVPQTVDIQMFCRLPPGRAGADAYRLLSVGSLVSRKNGFRFLSVLANWCRDNSAHNVEMWFAGDGPERRNLESIPLPSNLSVTFLGNVDYNELPEVYGHCGILAFPTLADEWGLVVNEAMASGLPVLGSINSQSVEDLVVDGQNGWVFQPDSEPGMYSAIDRLFSTPWGQLEEMRVNARNTASRVSISYVADRIMDAVRSVSP
jgi:glycosyltransferase involved in cell wall biosynthesis